MPYNLTAATNPGTATWTETAFTTSYVGGTTIPQDGASKQIDVGAFWPATADGGLVIIECANASGVPDATAIAFASSWDGSGNLTITANANATANTDLVVLVLTL